MSRHHARAVRRSHLDTTPFLVAALLAGCATTDRAPDEAVAKKSCTVQQGQLFIDAGSYADAVSEFSCVIDAQPTEVEGYRGRIEAELLLGRFADAVTDYARVTAWVIPVHPDARDVIYAGYDARLAAAPDDIPALTGSSFARWWFFQYAQAIHVLDHLLELRPDDVYGNLFRGSSHLLHVASSAEGVADLERAIQLAPQSPDVHYVVSDAYTYGQSDPERALAEATLALDGGLDTPRVQAILGAAYNALGDQLAAATHIKRHIVLVTTELPVTSPLAAGASLALDLVPGRTYEVPLAVTAGQTVSVMTSSPSHEIWDSILVLLGPDGSPVLGADDTSAYFAGFDWVAGTTGTYRMRVTSFESVSTGGLVVTRN
jgi:tetratricopeptide (TPR) repeat protein